jgi:hypothetical protein
MATFYPVCVTVAFFLAVILHDVFTRSSEKIPKHALEALVITLLMIFLSFRDMELISWGVLLIPATVLIICYFLGRSSKVSLQHVGDTLYTSYTSGSEPTPNTKPDVATHACPVAASGSPSILSSTSSPATSSSINTNMFTPITSCNMA